MKSDVKIRQHDKQDCAAACIASICSHYGLNLPLISIRDACGTNQEGTSIQGILDAAPKVGMSAKALKAKNKNASDLLSVDKPVILHLQKKNGWLHFVVLYGMDSFKALILDPEDGKLHKIPNSELEEEWSGYIIVMAPSPDFTKGDKRGDISIRFKELFKINKSELLPAFAGAVVYTIIGLSTSMFLQQIIDKVLPSKDSSLLLFFGTTMFILILLALFIGYFRSILTVRASIKTDCILVMNYLKKLLDLPVSFFNSRSCGELNARISDAYRIRSFLSIRLLVIFISAISLLISFVLLFTYYWKMAAITMIFIPLYCLLYLISDRINKRVNKKIIEESARFEETTIETIGSIRAIKYFGAEKSFSKKIERQYVTMAQEIFCGGRNISAFATASDGITKLLTFTIMVVGSLFVFRSELSIGEMVSFFTIASFFTAPIMTLIESNTQITEAKIAANRLFEIMDLESEDSGMKIEVDLSSPLDIIAEDISFSFPGRPKLFDGLSFKLEKGKVNAIIGKNGCGKSTIANILLKGYTPISGKITVGNIDLRHISTCAWRGHISIVPQRPDLFNGTILENIVPDTDTPDIEKVVAICSIVGLDRTLKTFPDGLLSRTGEQACRLSGGEKQKISIARALYRQPKALIFDEATSSIDMEGKKEIYAIMSMLAQKGMNIILISHDEADINIADNIIEIL